MSRKWRPTKPQVIGDRDVEAFFEPLPVEEQWRPIRFLEERDP